MIDPSIISEANSAGRNYPARMVALHGNMGDGAELLYVELREMEKSGLALDLARFHTVMIQMEALTGGLEVFAIGRAAFQDMSGWPSPKFSAELLEHASAGTRMMEYAKKHEDGLIKWAAAVAGPATWD